MDGKYLFAELNVPFLGGLMANNPVLELASFLEVNKYFS